MLITGRNDDIMSSEDYFLSIRRTFEVLALPARLIGVKKDGSSFEGSVLPGR
jgi:hypothetical protein